MGGKWHIQKGISTQNLPSPMVSFLLDEQVKAVHDLEYQCCTDVYNIRWTKSRRKEYSIDKPIFCRHFTSSALRKLTCCPPFSNVLFGFILKSTSSIFIILLLYLVITDKPINAAVTSSSNDDTDRPFCNWEISRLKRKKKVIIYLIGKSRNHSMSNNSNLHQIKNSIAAQNTMRCVTI